MKRIMWIVTLILLMTTGAFGNVEIVLAQNPSLITLPQSKSAAPELKAVNGYNNTAGSYIFKSNTHEKHWFKFTVPQSDTSGNGTFYQIEITTQLYSGVDVFLYNNYEEKIEYDYASDGVPSHINRKLNAGTYYVCFPNDSVYEGEGYISFSLTMQKDDLPDKSESAASLTPGFHRIYIDGYGDEDWYKFTAMSNQVTFTIHNQYYGNDNFGRGIDIYGSNMVEADHISCGYGSTKTKSVSVTKGNTYYVRIASLKDYEYGTRTAFEFKNGLPATTTTYVENTASGVRLSWNPVPGAAGYVIYRRAWNLASSGWTSFERWGNTTSTKWLDTKVYAGTRYQYGVKVYYTDQYNSYALGEVGPLKTTVRITPRILESVTGGANQLTVKWTPSQNFTGYQIKYATN